MKLKFHIIIAVCLLGITCLKSNGQALTFVNSHLNHIELNGADWSGLRHKLARLGKGTTGAKVNVVQIGDSHTQPDIATARVRQRLQSRYGDGGRGCIGVYRLAGTNAPDNYELRASVPASRRSRLGGHRPFGVKPGVTGLAVAFDSSHVDIDITDKGGGTFNHVTILHSGDGGYKTAKVGDEVLFGREVTRFATAYDLPKASDYVFMQVPAAGALYGAVLTNDNAGVVVSSIGNNGATYGMYLEIENFGEQLKALSPDLVILSLGTNEAVGSGSGIEQDIDQMVKRIRHANPEVQIVLTTPMEFHRRQWRTVTTRVKVRRRKYRTVRRRVSSYAPAPGLARVREAIRDYGKRHKIAVWDMYAVAGGSGAAAKWVANGLMKSGDHVHCTESGYELQGMLLSDALMECLDAPKH